MENIIKINMFILYLHFRDEARLILSRKPVVHFHKGFFNTVNIQRTLSMASYTVVLKQARQWI